MASVQLRPSAFRRTALAIIFLPLLLMAAQAAVILSQVSRLLDASRWVAHSSMVIAYAQRTEKLLTESDASLRGYLLTGQPVFLAPYQAADKKLPCALAALRRLVADNPEQTARVAGIADVVAGWKRYAARLLALQHSGGNVRGVMSGGEGLHRMDAIHRRFGDLIAVEEGLQASRERGVRRATDAALGILFVLALLMGVVLALAGWQQIRRVSRSYTLALDDAGEQVRATQESEARFQAFMNHTPAMAVIRDPQGRLIYGNSVYRRFLGARVADAWGETVFSYLPTETAEALHQADERVRRENAPNQLETTLPGPDNEPRRWLVYKFPLPEQNPPGCVGTIALDVTEQQMLEEQFRQAQKMEAVGRLAGGVAHDFNNMLAVINGYTGLLLDSPGLDQTALRYAEEIHEAAERAAGLTRQLLAFSRRQVLSPQVVDLNQTVAGIERMLRRLIGEDIELTAVLAPDLGRVMADPSQVEQVLLNLAVNARDAMPQGGKLTLETANVELDETYTRHHVGVEPGQYVMLAVSDTGSGMDPEVLTHIFEPFFTTKEAGRGTGLGLAMVHGIVKQSGGHVWVYSEPGAGTTFKIYLPRHDRPASPAKAVEPSPARGSETILLAEDEPQVSDLVQEILTRRGYRVLVAADRDEALRVSREYEGPIALLLTDVVMPGGSGRDLAEQVRHDRPEIRVLFMSGYTNDVAVRHGVLDGQMAFVQKPFTPDTLASRVREALDAAETPSSS